MILGKVVRCLLLCSWSQKGNNSINRTIQFPERKQLNCHNHLAVREETTQLSERKQLNCQNNSDVGKKTTHSQKGNSSIV